MISFVPNRHRNHDKCPRIGYISAGQLTALKENPGSGILQFSSTPESVLRQRVAVGDSGGTEDEVLSGAKERSSSF